MADKISKPEKTKPVTVDLRAATQERITQRSSTNFQAPVAKMHDLNVLEALHLSPQALTHSPDEDYHPESFPLRSKESKLTEAQIFDQEFYPESMALEPSELSSTGDPIHDQVIVNKHHRIFHDHRRLSAVNLQSLYRYPSPPSNPHQPLQVLSSIEISDSDEDLSDVNLTTKEKDCETTVDFEALQASKKAALSSSKDLKRDSEEESTQGAMKRRRSSRIQHKIVNYRC